MKRQMIDEHLRHMTDGRWHDECRYCLKRRREGGTGVGPDDRYIEHLETRLLEMRAAL